jgi:hydrogenase expression/formation protein HypC
LALKEEKISLVQTGSYAIVNFYYLKRNRDKSMCLAVPSKIIEIKDNVAKVDVDGVIRETSIMLMDDVKIGDYVIVHAGFAINKLDEQAAIQTLEDMRRILAAEAEQTDGLDGNL